MFKLIKNISNLLIKPPSFVNNIRVSSCSMKVSFSLSFFKTSWRNREYAITQSIKKCQTSTQIMQIIDKFGNQLNIVHLTAILDRIEQQNMLKIQKIVAFVLLKLKDHQQFLTTVDFNNVRTLCNIICYLGNLKNTELNYIFTNINYNFILSHQLTLQTSMLITGLIRLDIFKKIFAIKNAKQNKKLLLQEVVTAQYSQDQILSIWYAYISAISKQNEVLNNYMNNLIGKAKVSNNTINLRTYTYALICYVKCSHNFQQQYGPLYKLLKHQIPTQLSKNILPYQFSLLLFNMNKVKYTQSKQNKQNVSNKEMIEFPPQFQILLQKQFALLCQRKNITLRNIANIFKQFSQCFGIKKSFKLEVLRKVIQILQQQIQFASQTTNYQIDYKADLISLGSLTWKLSQAYEQSENNEENSLYTKLVALIVSYIKILNDNQLINKLTSKEILMIYSGFSNLQGLVQMSFDQKFKQVSIQLITKQGKKFTVKQITLIYTYFLAIRIYDLSFCQYVYLTLLNLSKSQEFEKNPKAKSILDKKCKLDIGIKCFSCFGKRFEKKQKEVDQL